MVHGKRLRHCLVDLGRADVKRVSNISYSRLRSASSGCQAASAFTALLISAFTCLSATGRKMCLANFTILIGDSDDDALLQKQRLFELFLCTRATIYLWYSRLANGVEPVMTSSLASMGVGIFDFFFG